MHEKLIKQLRSAKHCSSCPYDEDCNEFDSCLMDLLAADAIEDMNKRIARQEEELQEKDEYIKLLIGRWFSALEDEGVDPWDNAFCITVADECGYTITDYQKYLNTIV